MKAHFCGKGESLYYLAEMYQVDIHMLAAHNPHIKSPSSIPEGTQVTIPSLVGLPGVMGDVMKSDNKGNVCAYVADEPVTYKQHHVPHWPSEDYAVNFGSHTPLGLSSTPNTVQTRQMEQPSPSIHQQQSKPTTQHSFHYPGGKYYHWNGNYR
ncbi:LysM peptidoglycan-binding domain-containing protein [Bacillus alkalicellulosilyticus]|uniref:LysM peptidoglycan-binding domain-containing protein n=1 Tax=Alkalihalobacterium alkalicellulosilyticum TaxID=1912214 RepID=UPI000996E50F|nr:LysM peptidoglycan-binding domain-containing protein [Bacillus alkalicellulosilyticus]